MAPRRRSPNQKGGNKGGSRKGKSKARGASLDVRLDLVEQWLASAWTRSAMCSEAKKRWDVQPRTVDDYVAAVKKRIAEESKAGRVDARERQRLRLMRVIRETTKGKGKNWFAALAAENLLTKLEGTAYQPGDDLPQSGDATVTFDIDLPPEEPELEEALPAPKHLGAVA